MLKMVNKKKYQLIILCIGIALIVSCRSCLGEAMTTIEVKVYDDHSKIGIENVMVSFILTEGRTDYDRTDVDGVANTSWTGGPLEIKIVLEHDDYQKKVISVNRSSFTGDSHVHSYSKLDVMLLPLFRGCE